MRPFSLGVTTLIQGIFTLAWVAVLFDVASPTFNLSGLDPGPLARLDILQLNQGLVSGTSQIPKIFSYRSKASNNPQRRTHPGPRPDPEWKRAEFQHHEAAKTRLVIQGSVKVKEHRSNFRRFHKDHYPNKDWTNTRIRSASTTNISLPHTKTNTPQATTGPTA